MFKYDIVQYDGLYFVRRRLFGKFFERFLWGSSVHYNFWNTRIELFDWLSQFRLTKKERFSETNAVVAYEKLTGITKMKAKHQASKAEFKVYGS